MEKEISETYYYNPSDYDNRGRRLCDGITLRDVIKDFERAFHKVHSAEYATNLYANPQTMDLLAKSRNAAPFLSYGMELTQGRAFDADVDPYVNHEMDGFSKYIYVYGIDSAFMTEFDEYGYPVMAEDSDIYPLTLLIDNEMRDGTIRLAVTTLDDGDDTEIVTIDSPKYVYA